MTYAAPSFESKICPPEQLTARAAQIARPLVFTNGCFDILHRGHVTYLAQAAALGASMVVALNSDASVKRLGKGDDRPVNALEDRLIAILRVASEENVLVEVRRDVDSELGPFRSTMTTEQLAMLEQQLQRRKLLERYNVPRLSLFYLM